MNVMFRSCGAALSMTLLTSLMTFGCSGPPADDPQPGERAASGPPVGKADVTVGPITSMRCEVGTPYVRRGGFVEVAIEATDAQGSASRNYEIRVSPEASTRVVQRNKVILSDDGAYDIACCALDADLCDHTAVVVGDLHPALTLNAPRFVRGEGLITLTGRAMSVTGDLTEVMVDGRAVRVDADGRYALQVPAQPGPNAWQVTATDSEGRTAERAAWTLAGPFGDLDAFIADTVQLGLDPHVYPELAELVRRGVKPLWSALEFRERIRRQQTGREGLYSWQMSPTDFGIRDVTVEFEPHRRGIELKVSFLDVWLTAEIRTKLGFFGWKIRQARVDLKRLNISGLAVIRDGRITMEEADVSLVEPELEISDLPGFVEDLLFWFLEDGITEDLEEGVVEQLDEKMGEALKGFGRTTQIDLPPPLTGPLEARTLLTDLHADEEGLTLGMSATFDGETDPLREDAPGYWIATAQAPRLRRETPYEAGLSINVLNGLFYAGWQTGALDMSFTLVEEDIKADEDVPRVDRIDLFVDPKLPPVVRPGDAPGQFVIELSDVQVDAVLESVVGFINTSASVGGRIKVSLEAVDNELSITTEAESVVLDLEVAPANLERAPMQRYFKRLIRDEVFPDIARLSQAFPVPEADLSGLDLPGFNTLSVEQLSVSPSSAEGALLLGGRLVVK